MGVSMVHLFVAWKQSEDLATQNIMEVMPFLFKHVTGLFDTSFLQKEEVELPMVFMLAVVSRSDMQVYVVAIQIPLCSHLLGLPNGHPTEFKQNEDVDEHIPFLHKLS